MSNKKIGHDDTTTQQQTAATSFVDSDGEYGYVHVDAETVWGLSDLLMQLAAEINPHEDGRDGFQRQATLLAYATELKNDAAAHLDSDDGEQCRARLVEIEQEKATAHDNG